MIVETTRRAYPVIAGNRNGVWKAVKTYSNPSVSGDNAPETQNFKFVAWDGVRKALKLR